MIMAQISWIQQFYVLPCLDFPLVCKDRFQDTVEVFLLKDPQNQVQVVIHTKLFHVKHDMMDSVTLSLT